MNANKARVRPCVPAAWKGGFEFDCNLIARPWSTRCPPT